MKKFIVALAIFFVSFNAYPYTPIVYINGDAHNVGAVSTVRVLRDFMNQKPKDLAPSLEFDSTTIASREPYSWEYFASVSTFTYNQKLDNLANGLFFQAIAPFVFVANKIDTRLITPTQVTDLDLYLHRSNLAYGTLLLGYTIADEAAYFATINVDVIVPLDQRAKPYELRSPVIGWYGDHIASGVTLHAGARLVGNDQHNLNVVTEIQYHHLFKAHNQDVAIVEQATRATVNQALIGYVPQLIPAVYVKTQKATLESRDTLDILASLSYNYHKFFADFGCWYKYVTNATMSFHNNEIGEIRLDATDYRTRGSFKLSGNIGLACKEWIAPILQIPYAFTFSIGAGGIVGNTSYGWDGRSWDVNIKSGCSF